MKEAPLRRLIPKTLSTTSETTLNLMLPIIILYAANKQITILFQKLKQAKV